MGHQKFQETAKGIVEQYGEEFENNYYLRLEHDSEPVEDFSSERHRDIVVVSQSWRKNGDLMRDPSVKFRIEGDEWIPISIQVDPMMYDSDSHGLDLDDMLSTWEVNLREFYLDDDRVERVDNL
jgi:hypothetical protein